MREIFNSTEGKKPSTFLITALDDSELCNYLWAMQRSREKSVIRVCRGKKMHRTQGVFDEISAVFQFPYYFGENWAALEDCLSDLSWLVSDSYLMCITASRDLLIEDDDVAFKYFVQSIDSVAHGWAGGNPNLELVGRVPLPFHVMMQVSSGDEADMQKKLQTHGIHSDLFENLIIKKPSF
ncbi:barstar family protein [Variovorax sp. JS1663]|uniref:barstar family protein n=1 Tax=Variovorax sp. JS1663 TaxID=1851577 RepID=UPI000B3428C4|nr:barstar family protein [Variovorax sp. JS1663]